MYEIIAMTSPHLPMITYYLIRIFLVRVSLFSRFPVLWFFQTLLILSYIFRLRFTCLCRCFMMIVLDITNNLTHKSVIYQQADYYFLAIIITLPI